MKLQQQANKRRVQIERSRLAWSLMAVMACAGTAQAQSITGGLYGYAPTQGQVSVLVENPETGFRRELKVDANGRYTASGLNPGGYTVKISRDGQLLSENRISVRPNSDTAVAAASAQNAATELDTVVVTGTSMATEVTPIDVSTPELTNHYSRELINGLPLPPSATPERIALLRSNARHDSNTTGLVQLGGASPAENRYYLNEFDTTNDRTSLGSNRLPREAIQDTEVLAGSFGASWTNATGGIMAQTVRQGSNSFRAGYSLYLTPPTSRLLNPREKDIYGGDDSYYKYVSNNHRDSSATQYAWGSGALIKDKLFAFVLLGKTSPWKSYRYTINRATTTTSSNKNALVNLTWNINDDQTFNLIGSRDWNESDTDTYLLKGNYTTERGAFSQSSHSPARQRMLIGNYHWNITDDLQLRLMGGYLGQINDRAHGSEDIPYVDEYNSATQKTVNIGANERTVNFRPDDYWRRGYKGDLTWNLQDHKIVFGLEHYVHYLGQDWHTPFAGWYTYYDRPNTVQLQNGERVNGKYVQHFLNREFGRMFSVNQAAYIEDYWQLSDRVMVYAGLRYDKYVNKDALERRLFSFPMYSPRLGLSWDVNGDSSLKVGANLGRYSLSMPSNFSFGVAQARSTTTQWYRYTGIDPVTKAPTGLTQIGPAYVPPGRDGNPPQTHEVSATNLKAPYKDEFQAYVQKELPGNWIGQVDFGYSTLKRVINQTCYNQGIVDWANAHGYPDYEADDIACFEVNPGEDVTVLRDFAGDGKLQSLRVPASAFGLPKPKNKYIHLTFDLNHHRSDDEPYYLGLSYTWSRSFGNDNGFLDLEGHNAGYIGQTGRYDFPEITLGANGNLINDVRHKLTASGVYYFRNGLRVGGILNVQSGQPVTCFGLKPDVDSLSYNWGSWGHYCDTKTDPVGVTPAGTMGRLPWFWQLDLNVGYDLSVGEHHKLSLDLGIQNLTNRRGITDRYNTFSADINADNTVVPDINFLIPSQYQAPRTTSLVLRYEFK